MNKEQVLDLMEHISPVLVEEMEAAMNKKRMPKMIRAGLIAACLCGVLVGTAFAVEAVTGVSIREYFGKEEFGSVMQRLDPGFQASEEDNFCGYVIQRSGEGVDLGCLSGGVLEFSQEQLAVGAAPVKKFASLEELEAFLGIDLYDNEAFMQVTDAEYQGPELYDDNGRVTFVAARGTNLMCSNDEAGLIYFSVSDYYASSDGRLSVDVIAEAFRNGYEAGECAYLYPDGTQLTQEEFTTDRGEAVTIIRCDYPAVGVLQPYTTHTAHFYAYGVRYSVTAKSTEGPEQGLELLKMLLNSFEFYEIS